MLLAVNYGLNMKNKFTYLYSISTNKGIKETNEDCAFIGFNKSNQCLAIVCDGIGSEKQSDLASNLVIETFRNKFLKKPHIYFIKEWFKKVLFKASVQLNNIYKTKKKEIGTTLVLCLISNNNIYTFNIGDSRLYHFSMNEYKWKIMTKDHNLFNFLVDHHAPKLSFNAHQKNLLSLTNYIASSDLKQQHNKFNFVKFNVEYNDVIFLCSDGLYNFIDLPYISEVIRKCGMKRFNEIVPTIIQKSLDNHSNDNLSGIVIQFNKEKKLID